MASSSRKTTPALTQVWTYAIIDRDLLADDLDSAEGLMPALFWLTKDAAEAALIADLQTRWTECGPGADNSEAEMPPLVLIGSYGDVFSDDVEWAGDVVVNVYRLTLGS